MVLFICGITKAQTDCKTITDIDKFTGKISIKTPLECGFEMCNFILGKVVDKTDTTYYLFISLKSTYRDYGARGAYLLFEDEERLVKEEQKIDVSFISGNTYRYSTFLMLSKDQAERLAKHKIKAARLYTIEIEVKNQDAFICSAKKVIDSK